MKKTIFIYNLIIIILLLKLSSSFESNEESLLTCEKGPSYLLKYYLNGENITFDEFINRDSVHPLIELEKNGGKNRQKYINQYVNRLGPYFTFVGIGGATLICWIILSICWCRPKCCYNPNEGEPCLKHLMLIISITFLAGIFACCVSGFVYTERFKKNLYGSTCAIERLYYNIYDGQILNDNSNYKWIGFYKIIQQIYQFSYLENIIRIDGKYSYDKTNLDNSVKELSEYITKEKDKITEISTLENIDQIISEIKSQISDNVLFYETSYATINNIIMQLIDPKYDYSINNVILNLLSTQSNFTYFGNKIVKKYHEYKDVMYGFIYICFETLYSFMLSFAVLEILFIVGYVFGEKYILLYYLIVIFWYLIMLLSVTSFIIGACYGMITFGIKDGIGYIMYIFGYENINLPEPIIIGNYTNFIQQCIFNKTYPGNLSMYYNLQTENEFSLTGMYSKISELSQKINNTQFSLNILTQFKNSLSDLDDNDEIKVNLNKYITSISDNFNSYIQNEIKGETSLLYNKFNTFFTTFFNSPTTSNSSLNYPFSYMNCNFIKNDLQVAYKALYDLSLRTRVITTLTLCMAFFAFIAGIAIQITIMRYGDDNSDYYDDIDNKKESSLLKKQNSKINDSKSKNQQITRLSELQEFN